MSVYELLTELAACLCATIENEGRPETCFCGVLPGSTVAADFLPTCISDTDEERDGMGWVRLSSAYPAFAPGVLVDNPALVPDAQLGYDIEIGLLRSLPLDQDGIDAETAALVVTEQMADMLVIRKAISCCMAFERGDYVIGQYAPLGPMGGVVGGAFTVMVHQP